MSEATINQTNEDNKSLGGPATDEGKAISRLNATVHGLTGKLNSLFINDSDISDTVNKLKANTSYYGPTADILAERIVINHARIKKTEHVIQSMIDKEPNIDIESLDKYNRYYISAENRLFRSIKEYNEFLDKRMKM